VVKSAVISTSPAERTTSSAIVLSFPLLQLIHAFARAAIGPVSSSPRIVASDPPIWMPPKRCRRALKATQIAVPEAIQTRSSPWQRYLAQLCHQLLHTFINVLLGF
jgi:hypothetical protein